jgi:nicotinamide-nucleotide amidase
MTAAPRRPLAVVLAVGSELLMLGRADTNSPYIAAALQRCGFSVRYTAVVGDDLEPLTDAIAQALSRADLVVCTGGLGPTEDDRTRAAAAAAIGVGLHEDGDVLAAIAARFAARQLSMPSLNRRQALVLDGATPLPNPRGTAPGQWAPVGDRAVLLLPGPPREMEPMLAAALATHIVPRYGVTPGRRRQLVVAGRSESSVDEQLQPIYGPWATATPPIQTTILASLGVIEVHLSSAGDDPAAVDAALAAAVDALAHALGPDLVSADGRALEQVVGAALRARNWRIGVAESCTGGLVTSRLTDVAGSSGYVDRSVVVYSNAAKTELLGVDPDLIAAHGAVSEPVAQAMAAGLRATSGVDVAVAVTGIAGPGGGSPEKPVGTVCIAIDGPAGTEVRTWRYAGERALVKGLSATTALDRLRRYVAPTA